MFAGGDPNPPDVVADVPGDALVVAADSGAVHARRCGRAVDILVGDFDSIPAGLLRELEAGGTDVRRHPVDKDRTDLALALDAAVAAGATDLTVVGGHGGRLDHLLANALLLAAEEYAPYRIEARLGPARVTVAAGPVRAAGASRRAAHAAAGGRPRRRRHHGGAALPPPRRRAAPRRHLGCQQPLQPLPGRPSPWPAGCCWRCSPGRRLEAAPIGAASAGRRRGCPAVPLAQSLDPARRRVRPQWRGAPTRRPRRRRAAPVAVPVGGGPGALSRLVRPRALGGA